METSQKILKSFEKLLSEHCCGGGSCKEQVMHINERGEWTRAYPDGKCEKQHLYCGYELDHGIELEGVIEMIKNIINKTPCE